VERN
jgi:hypothetical protein